MPEFIPLSCPSCGGRLRIPNDIERLVCIYCGIELIVRRGEGAISLTPVIEEVKGVRQEVDHTASELAIARIQREIDDLTKYRNSIAIKRNTKGFLIGLAVLLICFAIFSSGFSRNNSSLGKLFCFVPMLLGILQVVIYIYINSKDRQALLLEQDKVNEVIDKKQEELAYHQKIVTQQMPNHFN